MFSSRCAFFLLVAPLLSATTYNCTDFSIPGTGTSLYGINNAGIAVGKAGGDFNTGRGLKYDTVTGTIATVQFPGAFDTEFLSINNKGVIFGSFNYDYGLDKKGWFTMDSAGNFKTVTAPPPYTVISAFGINDAGAISAVINDPNPSDHFVSAILNPDGSVTAIPGSLFHNALGFGVGEINNSRQVVADGLVDANTGAVTPIAYPPFPQADLIPNGLNNLGTVLGTISSQFGFTRDAGGTYSELICLGKRPLWFAINDNGLAVGIWAGGTIAAPLPGQAQANLSATSLALPATPVGQTSPPQTVTLTNSGNARLDIAFLGSQQPEFQVSGCVDPNSKTASLDPGASCTVTITAHPTASGQRTGTLQIDDSAPGAPHLVFLSVNGTVTTPTCQVSIGPPNQATFTIQDASGLSQILLVDSTNATVNIPSFTYGTIRPVTATATQTDTAQSSKADLRVTNVAGASTSCGTTFGSGGSTLAVTTISLPNGTVGTAYSQQLTASGGSGGNTWSITSGALPQGLTFDASGLISGTPTTAVSNAGFTVQVKDSSTATAGKALTITINAPAPPTLTITTTSLPNGTVGTAYSQQLTASGGSGGNTWSITSGALPQGLTLDASGLISGTPTTAVTNDAFIIQVKDSSSATASKALAITITEAAPPPNPQQQTLQLIGQVQVMVSAGILSSSQGARLVNILTDVIGRMNNSQTGPACAQLRVFMNQVNALVTSNSLTVAQAQPLMDAAMSIMIQAGC